MAMLEIKNILIKVRNTVNGLINRLDTLGKNHWAWILINRNFPKWNTVTKKKQQQQKTGTGLQELWNNYKSITLM